MRSGSQAALEYGLSDFPHFSNAFRQAFGVWRRIRCCGATAPEPETAVGAAASISYLPNGRATWL